MSQTNHKRNGARIMLLLGLLLVLAISATAIGAAPAGKGAKQQAEVKSYIVVMEDLPLVAYEGDIKGLPATKPDEGKKVNPNSAQARYNLGLAFAETRIFNEALIEWNKVIEIDPDGPLGKIAAENVELIKTYMELDG